MDLLRIMAIYISCVSAVWVANHAYESGNFLLWLLATGWMGIVLLAQLPIKKRRRRRADRRTW